MSNRYSFIPDAPELTEERREVVEEIIDVLKKQKLLLEKLAISWTMSKEK
ncbi:hypothetical protein [Virgibacillus sediminis]|uniref:Uncharacterized protein n=1 Tax=Virgibacillus sediminis TaxID=202260 RepID=A0ABV7A6R1_9BACI